MPARKANSSGKWSQSIWDVTPSVGDDVFANGFTVEIDVPIVVSSLRTTLSTGYAVAGGAFTLLSAISSVVANSVGFLAGTTTCLTQQHSSGTSFLTGNATGGSVAGAHGVFLSGSGNLTIFGNTLGGSIAAAYGAFHNSSGNLTINGNVSGSSVGVGIFNNSSGNIFINAPQNVRGGAGFAHGVQNFSVGSVYLQGNVLGGTVSTARGVINSSLGLVSIVGNLSANVGPAVEQSSTGTVLIDGDIYAYQVGATRQNGLVAASTLSRNEITGSLINSLSGAQAIYATRYLLKPKPFNSFTRMAGSSATNTPVFFYSPEAYNLSYVPHVSSVRAGVGYVAVPTLSGISVNIPSQLVGTMEIPDKKSVAAGELVGEEYGIAILKGDDLGKIWDFKESWNTPVETFNGTVGQRLQNILTIEEFGNIIKETTI